MYLFNREVLLSTHPMENKFAMIMNQKIIVFFISGDLVTHGDTVTGISSINLVSCQYQQSQDILGS